MSNKTRVLYLSYDGMTDPLGQSQVISYLRPLSKQHISFDLISFEKPELFEDKKSLVHGLIEGHDINWHPLRYHKQPPLISTLIDIRNGWKKIKELAAQKQIDIVHARSYIPAVMALRMKRTYGTKFLFDMRGWWADEKKESGLWNSPVYQPVYRYFKSFETNCFAEADRTIALTHAGKEEILKLGYEEANKVEVIPTCVNLDIFKPFCPETRKSMREELDIDQDDFVMIYSGALGGYYRADVVLDIFKKLLELRPTSSLVLLTRVDHKMVYREIAKSGAPKEKIRVTVCDFMDVHKFLIASDIGLMIYDPKYSALGRSPTKMGEYWACGLPVVTMRNVGDLNLIIDRYPGSGVQFLEFADADYKQCLEEALSLSIAKETLREYAVDYFDVNKGVKRYHRVYRQLSKRG